MTGDATPLVSGFVFALLLSLTLRILPLPPPPGTSTSSTTAGFVGKEVSIRSASSGKYLEVGDGLWLYASYFSHNKPACRFEVHRADPSLVRTLMATREYREGTGDRFGWDLRGASTPSEQEYGGTTGGYEDEYKSFGGEEPLAREDEEDGDGLSSNGGGDDGGFDGGDDGGFDGEEFGAEEDEGEIIDSGPSRRLLFAVGSDAADEGQPIGVAEPTVSGPGGPWVLLRSAYAGGFVEVVPRGQDDEYVVRVARDGVLSFRSLLRLSREGVWSYATQGYLNFREIDNDPRQHVRAHGNDAPFGPLRELLPTARMHVEARAPVRDVLGEMRCPSIVPPWDWRLLIDAARGGACDEPLQFGGAPGASVRRAASALRTLQGAMGEPFAYELSDLANAYRHVLLEPKWAGTVDLQLTSCATQLQRNAGDEGEGAEAAPHAPRQGKAPTAPVLRTSWHRHLTCSLLAALFGSSPSSFSSALSSTSFCPHSGRRAVCLARARRADGRRGAVPCRHVHRGVAAGAAARRRDAVVQGRTLRRHAAQDGRGLRAV